MFDASLTVLVASCDNYSDLWTPFSTLFRKYWQDCPYEIVLATESLVQPKPDTVFHRTIPCGKGTGWGDRLSMSLEQIQTPYTLLLCDDYFLCDTVDSAAINGFVQLAQKHRVGNLRLLQNPAFTNVFSEAEQLGEYKKATAYCIATQAGIWDTHFLQNLARGYASIWQFERKGSFALEKLTQPLLGTRAFQFPFEDVVHKGKWERHGIRLCQRNGIDLSQSKRAVLSDWDYAREHFKGFILNLNPTLIVRIQNLLKLGKQ